MALSYSQIVALYRRRARRYDFTANLYYSIGFREWAYRTQAVATLGLKRGDHVVEIGCGTGLNFALLQNAVGREGRITGVDLTDAMLMSARDRIARRAWSNVDLVHTEAAKFVFPPGVDGVLSTFALTLMPEFASVIQAGADALARGRRFVVLDFKMPVGRRSRLAPVLVAVLRPFGVSLDLAGRHPWEAMERCFGNVRLKELYGGFAYVAASQK